MPLGTYPSLCGEKDPIVSCKDPGTRSVYTALNPKRHGITKYRVDGGIIKDKNVHKCDWIVCEETMLDAYLIELKGSNIDEAIEQLESTAELLKSELSYYKHINYRIVPSKVSTKLYRTAYKKFLSKHPREKEFICRENLREKLN